MGDGLCDRVRNKLRVQTNNKKNTVSCEESKDVQNVSYEQGGSVCVSGSEESVSKLDDLCPVEGGGSRRGDAVCQEEVDGGEGGADVPGDGRRKSQMSASLIQEKSRNLDVKGQDRRAGLELQSKIQLFERNLQRGNRAEYNTNYDPRRGMGWI